MTTSPGDQVPGDAGPVGEHRNGGAEPARAADPDSRTTAGTSGRHLASRLVQVVGLMIAAAAVALCVRTLVREWSGISAALSQANVTLLLVAFVFGGLGMWMLALLWWRCLALFGHRRDLSQVTKWYFAGELGKYLPGGIWPVVGRGELARRDGVHRQVAYPTTIFSLGLMCVGGAVACGLLAPFFSTHGGRFGPELLLIVLAPIGVAAVHPAIFGKLLGLARRLSKGRLDLTAPSWKSMLGLIALATPPWFLVGGASVAITEALGYSQQPARVAFAAVAAWIIGFLAVPVPAGAGIRELLFIAACGLPSSPATAVAAIARVFLIVVDAVAGAIGLALLRRHGGGGVGTAHTPRGTAHA